MSRFQFLIVLLLAGSVHAGPKVPSDPILRIETGGHLAMLTRVDGNGQHIVTASEDKTLRVWSADSGRLLTVLRPPVGEGSLGALYAAALSPDGAIVAAGGNAAFDGRQHALYLFDRASGAMRPKGVLHGLEAPVQQIAWSPDGRYLAVGLRQQGIRVFRADLSYVGGDEIYNEAVFGLDFAPDGRLAAASLDGAVRLYQLAGDRLARVARRQLQSGQPYNVAFSPDGRRLAVGRADRPVAEVLDAVSLEALHEARYSGSGNLGRVAWSADGRRLYAGGTAGGRRGFVLLAFDRAGAGDDEEIARFDNILVSLAARPDGGVVVGTAEPSWAVFDAAGRRTLEQRRGSADFRDAGDRFQVSRDGRTVAFPLEREGDARVVFDSERGELRAGSGEGLFAPVTEARGFRVSQWKNQAAPQVDGRPLNLPPHDIARSLAVLPDETGFVLGSEWYLRRYDRRGTVRWERRTPAAAWAVNVSPDQRWVVAGLGDGTVRWYRLTDGAEQVALFPHPDRERWVAWLPDGTYDTSVNGEGLVGWHVNQAFNRASEFYPVGRFRKHYHYPAAIRTALATGDAALAARQARTEVGARAQVPEVTQILPPTIELRSEREVVTRAHQVTLRFAVQEPKDAPIETIRVRTNGQLARELTRRQVPKKGELEVPVKLPAGAETEISVVARNRHGASEPVLVHVHREVEPVAAKPAAKLAKPMYRKLVVFAVGVSDYPKLKPQFQLKFPSKDAGDFVNQLRGQVGTLYGEAEFRVLVNAEADRERVLAGLKWLADQVGPEDVGVLFLAGHGFMLRNGYYFAPADLDLASEDVGIRTAVPGTAIQTALASLKGRGIFFLDTCHSGFALAELRINTDMTATLNEMGEERSVVVLAGSAGRQSAAEADEWNNGAFTKALVEGLKGGADYTRQGQVTPPLLHTYVSGRVRALTENEQTPKMVGAVFDDPIALIRR